MSTSAIVCLDGVGGERECASCVLFFLAFFSHTHSFFFFLFLLLFLLPLPPPFHNDTTPHPPCTSPHHTITTHYRQKKRQSCVECGMESVWAVSVHMWWGPHIVPMGIPQWTMGVCGLCVVYMCCLDVLSMCKICVWLVCCLCCLNVLSFCVVFMYCFYVHRLCVRV